MKLNMRVQVNSNTREVRSQAAGFAMDFADRIAQSAAVMAREKVSPGKGPGPHPHVSVHEDTGDLMRDIEVSNTQFGFLSTATVYTTLDYGLYLEFGWHAKNGMFYRYPWLKPSMDVATQSAEAVAKTTTRRWFGDSAFSAGGTRF